MCQFGRRSHARGAPESSATAAPARQCPENRSHPAAPTGTADALRTWLALRACWRCWRRRRLGAQPAPEDSLSSWQLEAKPAPEEPALELERDPVLQAMELRVKRAKIGIIASGVALGVGFFAGIAALVAGTANATCVSIDPGDPCPPTPSWVRSAGITSAVLMGSGLVGMVTSSVIVRRRERELRRSYPIPTRGQWDPAQWRLVF